MNSTTGTNIADENILEPNEEAIDPQTAYLLTSVFLAISVLTFFTFFCGFIALAKTGKEDERFPQLKRHQKAIRFFFAALILWLVAMIFFQVYSEDLKVNDVIDYEGYMRITGVHYEERIDSRSKPKQATKHYLVYDAVYTVDWGYDWACPSTGQQCESTVVGCTTDICRQNAFDSPCTPEEYSDALAKAEACVLENGYDSNATYTPYNPLVGPSQDVDWPSLVAFGDCDACYSTTMIPLPWELRNYRIAGFFFLAAAAISFFVSIYFWKYDFTAESDEKGSGNPEAASAENDEGKRREASSSPEIEKPSQSVELID